MPGCLITIVTLEPNGFRDQHISVNEFVQIVRNARNRDELMRLLDACNQDADLDAGMAAYFRRHGAPDEQVIFNFRGGLG